MADGVCCEWSAARPSPIPTPRRGFPWPRAGRPLAADARGNRCNGSGDLATSEDELVPRLRRGDADAFRLLVDRFGDDLFRLACSSLGSEADASDLVQETLVGAFRGIAR